MMTKDEISSRISELREAQSKTALKKKEDNLRFLAEVIKTPISQIGPDRSLCAHYSERVVGHTPAGEPIIRLTLRKLDPHCAIEIYSKMCSHFEPDRVEVDGGRKTLQCINERAEEVRPALARRYGFI